MKYLAVFAKTRGAARTWTEYRILEERGCHLVSSSEETPRGVNRPDVWQKTVSLAEVDEALPETHFVVLSGGAVKDWRRREFWRRREYWRRRSGPGDRNSEGRGERRLGARSRR